MFRRTEICCRNNCNVSADVCDLSGVWIAANEKESDQDLLPWIVAGSFLATCTPHAGNGSDRQCYL